MDRFHPLFDEAVLTAGAVGNYPSACRLSYDLVQKTVRQDRVQRAQPAAIAAAIGSGFLSSK
jgi:hypothetical protein